MTRYERYLLLAVAALLADQYSTKSPDEVERIRHLIENIEGEDAAREQKES